MIAFRVENLHTCASGLCEADYQEITKPPFWSLCFLAGVSPWGQHNYFAMSEDRRRAPLAPLSSFSTSHLYDLVKPVKIAKHGSVQNWGGSFVCQPEAIFRPTNVEQCCAIIELARRLGDVEVRAMGRGHSPGDIVFTRGWIVLMHGLEGLVNIDSEAHVPSVTVLAGTYVTEINDLLEKATVPLSLKNLGSISEQSIAGLVSTATHGSGISHPVLSADVMSMRIICPFAEEHGGTRVVDCSRTENAELFNATLCGLGATGLIVEVTIAVDHWFKLKQVSEECSFDSIFGATTGSPSVTTRTPHENPFSNRTVPHNKTSINDKDTQIDEQSTTNHVIQQRQPIGYLLAHGKHLLSRQAKRYPVVERVTDPRIVYPVEIKSTNASSLPLNDDAVTIEAQRFLENLAASSQHVRLGWAPQAGKCTVMRMNRTLDPVQVPGAFQRLYDRIVGYHMLQLFYFATRYRPALNTSVNKAAYYLTHPTKASKPPAQQQAPQTENIHNEDTVNQFARGSFDPQKLVTSSRDDEPVPLDPQNPKSTLVDASYRVFNVECLFKQYTTEWAIPLSQAAAAIRAMRDWLDEESRLSEGVRIHFPVEIRFADADGIWLSPCQGRKTCFIGIVLYR